MPGPVRGLVAAVTVGPQLQRRTVTDGDRSLRREARSFEPGRLKLIDSCRPRGEVKWFDLPDLFLILGGIKTRMSEAQVLVRVNNDFKISTIGTRSSESSSSASLDHQKNNRKNNRN